MVTMAPFLMRLPVTSGQHDMVLPPLRSLRKSGGVVGLANVPQQQPQSQMPLRVMPIMSWVIHKYISLSDVSLPPFWFFIDLMSVLVYAFCFQVPHWMLYSSIGAQPLEFAPL